MYVFVASYASFFKAKTVELETQKHVVLQIGKKNIIISLLHCSDIFQ